MGISSSRKCAITQGLFVIVVAAFLLIPITNDLFSLFPERAPSGMPMANAAPPFSAESFFARRWQKRLEPRAKRHSGLWYPLTLVANEIYSRVFGQISAFNGGSVKLGKDNYLFQAAHLPALNHRPPKNIRKLPQRVADIKELQERLRARGKSLLIVITPNMATLYPELIPSGFYEPARLRRQHPYVEVEKAFKEYGIVYVDTVATLRSAMSTVPFRFFTPTGSHWNDVASCISLRAINHKLKEMGGRYYQDFSCDDVTVESAPRSKDRDLLDIANVLFPERFFQPTPYVKVRYLEPAPQSQPSTLLVGTSYLFAISEHLHDWNLAKDHQLYFYFRSWRRGGEHSFHELPRKRINWEAVLSNDIIIVNAGIGNPVTIGYGFIEEALAALRQLDDQRASRGRSKQIG